MNLLYILLFTNEGGGVAKNGIVLANEFAKKCKVFMIVGTTSASISIENEAGRLELPINKKHPFSLIDPKNAIRVKKYANKNKIDAVFYSTCTPTNDLLLIALHNYRQFAIIHNLKPHIGGNRLFTLLENITVKFTIKRCKRIAVTSHKQLAAIEKKHNFKKFVSKIEVIYLGQQTSMLFDIPEVQEDIDVLFYGRIEYYKGIDVLIRAMQTLNLISKNCTIIGKGNLTEALGTNMTIPDNINIVNKYVPDKELAHYIKRCKVFVLPYREATGTQIVQTVMYYGKPIVATNTGSLPEYMEDGRNGIIVPIEDPDALAKAIVTLLNNPDLRKQYSENAKIDLSNKYSNEKIADQYLKMIFKIN